MSVSSAIPNFEPEPELEDLLDVNPSELDEETLFEVQLYKARKLKAKQRAGIAADRPEWWHGGPAPIHVNHDYHSGSDRPSTPETNGQSAHEPRANSSGEDSPEEPVSDEESRSTERDVRPEEPPSDNQSSPVAQAPRREGLPKIGWSSDGVTAEASQEPLDHSTPDSESGRPPDEDPSSTVAGESTGDPILDYYRNIKHSISSPERKNVDQKPVAEPEPEAGASQGNSEQGPSDQPSSASGKSAASPQDSPRGDASGSLADASAQRLLFLEQRLEESRRDQIQLRETIADLREERARLEERLRFIQDQ